MEDVGGAKNLVTFLYPLLPPAPQPPPPPRKRPLSPKAPTSNVSAAPQSGSAITHGYLNGGGANGTHNVKERPARYAQGALKRKSQNIGGKGSVYRARHIVLASFF